MRTPIPMRILLVEDNADSRGALQHLLGKWGYEVAAAENLKGGITYLETGPFDAILSDIALPDGTGYALVSEARRHAVPVLAIAMSAFQFPDEVNEPKLTGFDHHLEKPLDTDRLRSLLDDALLANRG